MIVCPVCAHEAQGPECEVCGKRLGRGPSAADLALPPLPELEPTSHGRAAAALAEPLPGLEPTRHAAAALVADAVPDLEATRAAPVDVAVEPTPDVERTSAPIPGDSPTALPTAVTCRYCRTPAAPGERLCGRCGMRLPSFGGAREAAAPAARVCSCGARVGGGLCPSCGARS